MKRPSFTSYLFGNPMSLVVLFIALVWTAYGWWTDALSGWLPLIALVVFFYGLEANHRIQKFNAWQREWKAMGDHQPIRLPMRSIRTVIGVALCIALLFYAFSAPPSLEIIAARWVLGVAVFVMAMVPVYRRIRERLGQKQAAQDVPITQCLILGMQTETLNQAYASLPNYCSKLIQRVSGLS